jgi:hypothetical protein
LEGTTQIYTHLLQHASGTSSITSTLDGCKGQQAQHISKLTNRAQSTSRVISRPLSRLLIVIVTQQNQMREIATTQCVLSISNTGQNAAVSPAAQLGNIRLILQCSSTAVTNACY